MAFQAYINLAFCEYMNQFVIAYFNNIVVYSNTVEEHTQHIQLMLQKLRKFNLFVKLSKCIFDALEIEFVKFIVDQEDISMNPGCIKTVVEWPLPKSFRDIQQFLGFANFYCHFIDMFSWVAAGLSDILKSREKGKFKGKKLVLTKETKEAFEELKQFFTTALILVHYDPAQRIMVESDASSFAISVVISQLLEATGQWYLMTFWSRKMQPANVKGLHSLCIIQR